MPTLEGALDGAGLRVCIVVARWNEFVTRKLLDGAESALQHRGIAKDDVTVAWVPGAFEVPTAANWAARSGRFDAVICIGAVIRGDTAHFEYVAGGATEGIGRIALETGVPVIFGVLTVDNVEQAMSRAGGKDGHKGEEAAQAAIEMANLRRLLRAD
ncbi:MAG: 6,7-dimethyl-8-ribityllumazine synthase [Dehalococcoidia bacterium]|jgi:6,7-dimethyl-8-ribityllumazine synthase|uniref:6,7-dimethyl-8-ribityllumazine synthase n=1 Tax=Candidatus Amarobacter glycogenicus TaxID=3140699 RepID=UPI001D2FECF7|nr:6,7-dimethyl-8-ribityllumazine synthase [Dehalococcoidia bacterium]MBK6561502.1 6,7-dimethyl-8-ribityllumazine synthase [Dehalococcoidia bacterium]MBK7127345.1 6,7-dimethyl-8-ribityllumazine synthase [Dehalococcoidia bacterium]MBK7726352.1 6,7-dimethyl-8-ribityllumazine synthase [Dehalococcoidia bacterium]MBK8561416.1 6,7-dimethyl-8-ribityllumazine synthase [Dehalococcoidia bacterium]